MKKIFSEILIVSILLLLFSCAEKNKDEKTKMPTVKIHSWYYFSNDGFQKIDLPQNAPEVYEKPWTESVRITSAASLANFENTESEFSAYALVNKKGLLCFNGSKIEFHCDNSIFSTDTADSLVLSDGRPVFYLYRSIFFNPDFNQASAGIHSARPFLVEFAPDSRLFYPIVSYSNLNLNDEDQITGYFWDGKTWACAAKKALKNGVEFSYFCWQPLIPLTQACPALSQKIFMFNPLTESSYKKMILPRVFEESPEELKSLLASIPNEFSFYISWKNPDGTSPVNYSHTGTSESFLSAHAGFSSGKKYIAAVFSDGTTYIKRIPENSIKAFRLPLLPKGFSYGDMAISGDTLYVAWEESSFFKTARAGFISINLKEIN